MWDSKWCEMKLQFSPIIRLIINTCCLQIQKVHLSSLIWHFLTLRALLEPEVVLKHHLAQTLCFCSEERLSRRDLGGEHERRYTGAAFTAFTDWFALLVISYWLMVQLMDLIWHVRCQTWSFIVQSRIDWFLSQASFLFLFSDLPSGWKSVLFVCLSSAKQYYQYTVLPKNSFLHWLLLWFPPHPPLTFTSSLSIQFRSFSENIFFTSHHRLKTLQFVQVCC